MKNILHISHTNIASDIRIIKEINSISQLSPNISVRGLGFSRINVINGTKHKKNDRVELFEIKSIGQEVIVKIPRVLRLIFLLPVFLYLEMFILTFLGSRDRKWQVVHCHDVLQLPVATIIAILNNSKLIYDAHELESKKNGNTLFGSRVIRFVEFICLRRISLLITVSSRIKDFYVSEYGCDKVIVVYNSPYMENISIKSNLESPFKPKRFVYVGLFSNGRGIPELLKVFSGLPDIEIDFIGDGHLRNLILSHQLKYKNIRLVPPMPHSDLMSALPLYDVGICYIPNTVSLSDYYALPNKIFEYTFAGLFVISTKLPEVEEYLDFLGAGITISFDYNSLEKAILSHVKGKAFDFDKLKLYSWELQFEKLACEYRSLLD